MELFLIALAFLVIVLFVKTRKKNSIEASSDAAENPFYLKSRLFTPPELKYLEALEQAVGSQYRIMGKVRIADIFGVRKSKHSYSHFNRIKAKHFDYVLCDARTYKPVAAIELDDASHQRKSRAERDDFVNRICLANDFPLLRVALQHDYDLGVIKRSIEDSIGEHPTGDLDLGIRAQPE
ncbi:MAG: DUF2726 domain-containing protein [Oceanospirillaceae bacterium]|nr:DUF2726 domain-containing protein [Oceanospirillaceae bacterium]